MFNFGLGCHVCKRSISDAAFVRDERGDGSALYWVEDPQAGRRLLFCTPACSVKHTQNTGTYEKPAARNGE